MDPNAPNAGARRAADALVRLLEARHGGRVELVGQPESKGEGFDSAIHLVQLAGDQLPAPWREPLVLRVKAEADRAAEAEREAAMQGWLADRGYPVPRVLEVFAPGALVDGPTQVMERARGSLAADQVLRAPWRARRLVGQLAALQARLHAVPSEGFPTDEDLLDRRLRHTRATASATGHGGLRAGLARVEAIAPALRDAPPAICHGDFHPLNVLVDGDRAAVIDWTDAGVGDRAGDLARTLLLFDLAAIIAGSSLERVALRVFGPRLGRTYRREYGRHAPVDDHRLVLWRPVHLLHGWSQAVGLHAGPASEDPTDDRAGRLPPGLADELARRFETAMAEAEATLGPPG